MINLFNQIYSLQGQKLISLQINQRKQHFTMNHKNFSILPLISTNKNQHVYFAYYVNKIVNNNQEQLGYHKQESRQIQLRIQKLQLYKKHLIFKNPSSYHIQKSKSKNQQPNNQNQHQHQQQQQQLNNNYLSIPKKQTDQFYNKFFYYQPIGPLSQKRNYLIFCSQNRIDFYFQINNNNENYSNRKRHNSNQNNLILDKKRSIDINNMNKLNIQQQNKIISIVRLHNYLIVLLQNNRILLINLHKYLNPKLTKSLNNYIVVDSSVSINYQKQSLHIIQSQQKYFYIQGQANVYKFQIIDSESSLINEAVNQIKLVKKYVLIDTQNCQFNDETNDNKFYQQNYKCTQQIDVLQDYIIVQRRINKINTNNMNRQHKIQHYLIDKSTDKIILYNLPFSHLSHCERQPNLIKITLTKNKNTNYIISLMCIIQYHQTNQHSADNSNKILIQHLSLQTLSFSQSLPSSSNLPSDGIDFSKFRLPLIALSIGLIFYITIKKSGNNKQKYQEEQNNKDIQKHKELEQQIMNRIIQEKERRKLLEDNSKNIQQMNKIKKDI